MLAGLCSGAGWGARAAAFAKVQCLCQGGGNASQAENSGLCASEARRTDTIETQITSLHRPRRVDDCLPGQLHLLQFLFLAVTVILVHKYIH
jgi:hypothetical protein